MAPLPFQFLCALGQDGILCASRGDTLYTFGADCALIAEHSLGGSPATAPEGSSNAEEERNPAPQKGPSEATSQTQGTEEEVNESATPPPKRRKVDSSAVNGGGQKKKKAEKPAEATEKAYVILLKATGDGSHVVAVTGGNKTVHALEHDGKGHLTGLSQRQMVKRPSDIALTADEKTILVADKFGDVYALPLIPSADDSLDGGAAAALQEATLLARKGANNLTVHTQRNLRSLEEQARQRAAKAAQQQQQKDAGPTFKQDLLLGHVSMLTSIVAATADGRPYILTGDRDEHIRVSRGIPQAHVIENFCLGHTSFISTICLPRPDLLVSGGGDSELFAWDWKAGVLKSKVELLQHAKNEANVDGDKIDVTGLYPCHVAGGSGLLMAICERVKAVFVFKVQDGNLVYAETINVAGYPLDIAFIQVPGQQSGRMVVSLDQDAEGASPSPSGLYVHLLGNASAEQAPVYPNPEGGRIDDLPRPEVEKILYTIGNLRKTEMSDDVAAGGDNSAAAGEAGEPAPEAAEDESGAP
ncbi:tRNA (guanine(10)-N2)-methyltransferase [Apiospora marii]|uniref:tRNA (guanine(10)-N2)-methyltransferase n=1 Tax=Apiospora marii TaxID=335849 RepID=UPI00312D166D